VPADCWRLAPKTTRSACCNYLEATQEADGHWAQNMWLDGRPYWNGLQMDETAFPILLVDLLRRESPRCFGEQPSAGGRWCAKQRPIIVANGPVTQQDRWEEDGGYSPFTLAAEISALLIAADLAQSMGHPRPPNFLRENADTWNDNIERWTYAVNSDLARQVGVEGYYVRIAPPDGDGAASPLQGFVPIKNRATSSSNARAIEIVSPDALALVRFGLRAHRRSADDEHDQSSSTNCCAKTSAGCGLVPLQLRWLRRTRRWLSRSMARESAVPGRCWPGSERTTNWPPDAPPPPRPCSGVMENSTGTSRLIPEQVWDTTTSRARTVRRKGFGLGVPAGVGALRIHQVAAVAARRKGFSISRRRRWSGI
jgi:glucoamylase